MVEGNNRGGRGPKERSLADYCQYLKGVGPARAVKLTNLGIENVNDLLTHYPRKYYDRRRLVAIARLQPGVEDTFVGRVMTASQRSQRRRRSMVAAAIGDETGIVQVVWFNQPFLLRHLKPGTELILNGMVRTYRGQRQVVNPEFEIVGEDLDDTLISGGRIVPVYRLTSGVTQRTLRQLLRRTIDDYRAVVVENLPAHVIAGMDLPSRADALRAMHFPADEDELERARSRIKVEELFYMQLVFSLQRRLRGGLRHVGIDIPFDLEKRFVAGLGFELTGAQKRVLDDIRADLGSDRGMNRLLQGDVGCGKTVVAGATLLSGVEAGCQAAMMVPTEILAAQHFHTLSPHFDRLGVRAALLIGSLRAAEKRVVHEGIADGSVQVVIGTHALIQSDVRFRRLAIVVIDEQHRFGVRQRAALVREGEATPHMLVMTATPIPRTLALTAYADLDLSVIDEMPATRMPVKTRIVHPSKRDAMYQYIREQQDQGRQAYLLYPVIEETEKQDLEAAETAFEELSRGPFRGTNVGMLHGRMSTADKDRMMRAFAGGDIRVLVATTVVEVGVHVPAATIIVIHHPERFGLSQLHQLRGRVGRGGREGYCFLVAGDNLAPETMERLEVLVGESDGFRIAEEDLRLRGPGEFLGVRQHGVPGFKVANPLRDGRLVERVNAGVRELLETDPALQSPDGKLCRRHLRAIITDEVALRAVV